MSAASPPPAPSPDPAPGEAAEDLRLLGELAAMGMCMARALAESIAARGDAPAPLTRIIRQSRRFDRIASAVRITLALKARVRTGEDLGLEARAVLKAALGEGGRQDAAAFETAAQAIADAQARRFETLTAEPAAEQAERPEVLFDRPERLERGLERERDDWAGLLRRPAADWLRRILSGLGLGFRPVERQDEAGPYRAWAPQPPSRRGPLLWVGQAPAPWTRFAQRLRGAAQPRAGPPAAPLNPQPA